jgi:hypothetical protein
MVPIIGKECGKGLLFLLNRPIGLAGELAIARAAGPLTTKSLGLGFGQYHPHPRSEAA